MKIDTGYRETELGESRKEIILRKNPEIAHRFRERRQSDRRRSGRLVAVGIGIAIRIAIGIGTGIIGIRIAAAAHHQRVHAGRHVGRGGGDWRDRHQARWYRRQRMSGASKNMGIQTFVSTFSW